MATSAAVETGLRSLPLASISPNPDNPRKHFDHAALKELAESIKSHGVLQPIVVRQDPIAPKKFELVMGERRYRASKLAGKTEIPAIVSDLTDRQALEMMVIENLQREDVHPLEEALGYQALLQAGAEPSTDGKTPGEGVHTAESVAAKIGKSVSYIYCRLKLLALIPAVREGFQKNFITAGHAVLIARLQPKDQVAALFACFNMHYDPKTDELPEDKLDSLLPELTDPGRTDWTLIPEKALREWIQDNVNLKLKGVPWDLADAELLPDAGACTTCPKRSTSNPSLFADLALKSEDTCFDPSCFKAKREAFVQVEIRKDRDRIKDQERAHKVAGIEPGEKQVEDGLRQLSEQSGYTQPKADQKVLKAGQWLPAKKGSCSSVETGIIVRGDHAGERRLVCSNGNCKVHKHNFSAHSSGGARTQIDYEKQRFDEHRKNVRNKKKVAARFVLAKEMVNKVGSKILPEFLRDAVLELADRRNEEELTLRLAGFNPKTATFKNIAEKAKGDILNQLLVGGVLCNALNEFGDDNKARSQLLYLAKRLGLKNPQAILDAQDKRIGEARSCRGCGCTEETACEYYDQKKGKHVHCSWIENDLCSNEACKTYAPAKVQASAKEPKKAGKKKG